jgi:AAA+ superfamily predicted ATPase
VQTLGSSSLSFTRNGRALVTVDEGAVTIVDIASGVARTITAPAARAAVGFPDQVWIAADARLSRYTLGGEPIDSIALVEDPHAALVGAAVGAPAAVWTAATPVAIVEERGALVPIERAGARVVAPLTGRRWVTSIGSRVMAPSGLSCELGTGAQIIAGAIVHDGAAVALVAEHAAARELVVVGLASGRVQLRRPLHVDAVRIAPRRGAAAMLVEPDHLVLLDLRSGRAVGELACRSAVIDFAIDPDARQVALRSAETTIELVSIGAPARTSVAVEVEVAAVPDAELDDRDASSPNASITIEETMPVDACAMTSDTTAMASILGASSSTAPSSPPTSNARGIDRPLELAAMAPRDEVTPLDKAAALALLDEETATVGLLVLAAIARAWDTRRIGYGNESKHPYEHEVAALLGMNHGFATEHVAAARAHLTRHLAELERVADRRGPATPIGALAAELGLSPLAIDILLVIAAPALWSDAARLYGILANDPDRAIVDEALVEQIFAGRATRHELARELDPRAPLVRLGIVSVGFDRGRKRPFAGLDVDPIILARLRCEPPDLGAGVTTRGSDRALEELALDREVIPNALAAIARATAPIRIALRGRPGSGRRTLVASLAAEAGRALGVVDVTVLPRDNGELARQLAAALRRAQLAGLFPCVVNLDAIAFGETPDGNGRSAIVDTLRAHPGPLAVVLPANETAPFDAGHVAIDLPVLVESERLALWRGALADAGLLVDPQPLAARYRVGPGVIHRAVAAAVESAGDATAAIEELIRRTRDARLGAHAARVERLGTWDSLVLPPDVLDSLRELVARVRHRQTVFEAWGMDATMATSRGLTALFSGPPGTGKTMVAGVLARELGLELYRVDVSKVMSKWLGETERNLATIFDAAEDGRAILLFDEADSLFAKRTEVRSSNDRYANLEVNYLLQRLDTFEGIAILTTNAGGAIDPAFKRRLSFRLSLPFPDEETRTQLWRAHLPARLPTSGALDVAKLARKYQLSGGYIRNACLRAAFLAAQDATRVAQEHLERAVALEFAEFGKLTSGGKIE